MYHCHLLPYPEELSLTHLHHSDLHILLAEHYFHNFRTPPYMFLLSNLISKREILRKQGHRLGSADLPEPMSTFA